MVKHITKNFILGAKNEADRFSVNGDHHRLYRKKSSESKRVYQCLKGMSFPFTFNTDKLGNTEQRVKRGI